MYAVTDRYKQNIAKNVHFTSISGAIVFRSGESYGFDDSDILEGSLGIVSKMNSAGEFRAGGVYSSELSVTLMDFTNKISNLYGASVSGVFRLHTDSTFTDYDEVALGTFYIDNSTIKRKGSGRVSFKATDSMLLFDKRCYVVGGTLYQIACEACSACGVEFGMTQAQFEALPNSGIIPSFNITRIQTWRDALGYIAELTNSFARMSRHNKLEFVHLTCEKDENKDIIPDREILGTVRFDTEFSDSYELVSKIVMMRSGVQLSSTVSFVDEDEGYLTVEWRDNPLLAGLTDDEVTEVLNTAVMGIYHCHSKAFKASISDDPALEIGDYVRLRQGDSASGNYGVGMITTQSWKYRGKHSIGCSMPLSVSSDPESRNQPKSQEQKEIDELKAGGTGGDTIENAIIIEEKSVRHLIHSYTTVGYFHGNKLVYGGAKNPVIVNGTEFHAASVASPYIQYEKLSFQRGTTSTNSTVEPKLISWRVKSYNDENGHYTLETLINDEGLGTFASLSPKMGFYCTYSQIHAPESDPNNFPYGFVACKVYRIYTNTSGVLVTNNAFPIKNWI